MISSRYDRRRLLLIAGVVLIVVVIIGAGLSMQNDDDEGPDLNYRFSTGDFLEWSEVHWTNRTMADTDHWNYSAQFYLENGINIYRTTVIEQNETNETLSYSRMLWQHCGPDDIMLAYQGIFPELKEDRVEILEGGYNWYGGFDPDQWDENWTYARLSNETVLTAFGPLVCEHHRLSSEYFVPGILNFTEGYNCTEIWDWWLFDDILVKRYRSSMTEEVPDDVITSLYFLTGTNMASIIDPMD